MSSRETRPCLIVASIRPQIRAGVGFSDNDERRRQLIKKIKGHGKSIVADDDAEKEAVDLIALDHNEVDDVYGQRVSDVFHLGDCSSQARTALAANQLSKDS
ncbi:hypothetical protein ACCT02_14705 [Rhizobium ruizarguesonis]